MNIECRFFEASVEIKAHAFAHYFWFLMESGYAENVDFDQTKCKLTNSIGDFIYEIVVATYDDLLAKRKNVIGEFKFIKAKHTYLKPEFKMNNLDLFTLSILSSRIIISEKLKDALELNRVSGIEIIQANVHVS